MEYLLPAVVSAVVSLVVSYVGVRYFTGPRMQAERAMLARGEIRDAVSPLRRDIREFRAGMRGDLRRDRSADQTDGVLAQRLLLLAHDLPRFARRSFQRRLDVVFGTGWMRLARLRDTTVSESETTSTSYMTALALLDGRQGVGRSYVDGLLHRALTQGPTSREVAQLEIELARLEQGR